MQSGCSSKHINLSMHIPLVLHRAAILEVPVRLKTRCHGPELRPVERCSDRLRGSGIECLWV